MWQVHHRSNDRFIWKGDGGKHYLTAASAADSPAAPLVSSPSLRSPALGWIPFYYCPSAAGCGWQWRVAPWCILRVATAETFHCRKTLAGAARPMDRILRDMRRGLEVAGARTSTLESIAIKIKTDIHIKLASPQRWKSKSDNWFVQAALKSQMRTKNKKLPC